MAATTSRHICYTVLPLDQPSSDLLWREGVSAVFQSPDLADTFRCVFADDLYNVGVIVDGVRQLLQRAALVIADLTGRDPSVTFQVGMATAMGLPVVILLADTADMDDVPFDWQVRPIVRYATTVSGSPEFRMALSAAVRMSYRKDQDSESMRLLEQLRSEDRSVRREGEETLGRMGDPVSIGPLCELLADQSANVRASAGMVLRRMGGSQVVDALLSTFDDPRPYVRRTVAWVLRELHDDRAVEPLLRKLHDQVAIVRRSAAWTLGEMREQRAVALLVPLLLDKDPDVRQGAAEALGKLGELSACEALMAALEDPDGMVRQAAAKSLGELKDSAAVDALIAATGDAGWMVRHAAARALGAIGNPRACPALKNLLQDINEDVRWAAVTGLAEMNIPDSRAMLHRAASDPDQTPFIRGLAAAATVGDNDEGDEEAVAA